MVEYSQGYVYELMDQGGPTDNREPYFKEAVDEMMRARTLCAKANQAMPDDPSYVGYLEELFGRKLDDVRILTPFTCDFGGGRVKFGKSVFINHSAILSASGGIEFGDNVQVAPGARIATINHDFNARHSIYTYGKVTIKKNTWIGMNVTICPGVTIGEYAVIGAGAVVTKDIPDYAVAVGSPAKVIKMLDPSEQQE
ncbi:DapH/DapD/GlmU-related protein [Bifidobacterium moukalabense]|uniref:DapH/DapD/GlmU-related protein n=1 Tax=Bifidobacterium moukalabense TaxID=1333651 RepID=UPI001BB2D045|nr:DapH/DapD/GlmU-related protein [Bifidobacterium moukalabense]